MLIRFSNPVTSLVDPAGVQCTETSLSGNYSDTVEGEQITLECQIGFFGFWGPTQNWTDNQGTFLHQQSVNRGHCSTYQYGKGY